MRLLACALALGVGVLALSRLSPVQDVAGGVHHVDLGVLEAGAWSRGSVSVPLDERATSVAVDGTTCYCLTADVSLDAPTTLRVDYAVAPSEGHEFLQEALSVHRDDGSRVRVEFRATIHRQPFTVPDLATLLADPETCSAVAEMRVIYGGLPAQPQPVVARADRGLDLELRTVEQIGALSYEAVFDVTAQASALQAGRNARLTAEVVDVLSGDAAVYTCDLACAPSSALRARPELLIIGGPGRAGGEKRGRFFLEGIDTDTALAFQTDPMGVARVEPAGLGWYSVAVAAGYVGEFRVVSSEAADGSDPPVIQPILVSVYESR